MHKENKEKWERVLVNLKKNVTPAAYDGFLKNMVFIKKEYNKIYIAVFNDFIEKRIREKYLDLILEMVRDVQEWSNVEEIDLLVDEEIDTEIDEDQDTEEIRIPDYKFKEDSSFTEKYTFENFVKGSSNAMAMAASQAVAEDPGSVYNPLFIYGGVGLGKTHLMKAIGQKVLTKNPDARVIYNSSEQFMNEMIASIRLNKMDEFKKTYRMVDVLLIDDIQFLVGKEATQEEFFHTFNELYDRNKQIVISSDRPPGQIQKLEDRLISRFESGMIADIKAPDLELRIAILKNEAANKGMFIEDEALIYLSKKIISNIRKLEGAFIRVCAYANLNKTPVTSRLIDEVLKDMIATSQKKIDIEDIKRAVAAYFKIKLPDMTSSKRSRNIAFPRQIAMYLSKEFTNEPYQAIGKAFGKKDHTTVIHACKKVSDMLITDLEFKAELDNIIRIINE